VSTAIRGAHVGTEREELADQRQLIRGPCDVKRGVASVDLMSDRIEEEGLRWLARSTDLEHGDRERGLGSEKLHRRLRVFSDRDEERHHPRFQARDRGRAATR